MISLSVGLIIAFDELRLVKCSIFVSVCIFECLYRVNIFIAFALLGKAFSIISLFKLLFRQELFLQEVVHFIYRISFLIVHANSEAAKEGVIDEELGEGGDLPCLRRLAEDHPEL